MAGLQGTATNTLKGEDVLGNLEAQAQEYYNALAQRTAETGQAAQQAQQNVLAATQAPQEVPNDFVSNLFSNLASVVSQQPSYRENRQEVSAQNKADLLKKRADNLAALRDIYSQRADEAQKANDLEVAEKYRTKLHLIDQKYDLVNANAERANRLAAAKIAADRPVGGATGAGFDPMAIAMGIHEGTIAPDPTGFSRGQWGLIVGSLRQLDPKFNVMKSGLDYRGVRQFVQTLNQGQQVALRQRAENAMKTADYIDELIKEVEANAPPRTAVTAINRAQLNVVKNGAWGPKAAVAATRLSAQIGAWQTEMGSVYSGGYAPQQAHLKQAHELIDPNWSIERIKGGLDVGRRDTNIRLGAVNEVGAVTPSNPLVPGGAPQGSVNVGPNPMGFGGATPESTQAPPIQTTGQLVKMLDKNNKPRWIDAAEVPDAIKQGGWKRAPAK